jgi:hypothetical protein
VLGTGNAVARGGATAVTGLSGPVPGSGASARIAQTGHSTATAGGNANSGYQHIENLYVVRPSSGNPQSPPVPHIPGWAVTPDEFEETGAPEPVSRYEHAPENPGWWVSRPRELAAVVDALTDGRAMAVGITTGLYGAGGFGKTTLALMACADQQVRDLFGDRVYPVTLGRDLRGLATVAAKINDVIKLVSGTDATFTDPRLAGQCLGRLLDSGPSRLLVLDDVWEPEQLAPFTDGGKRCVRLVTTRVPELLTGRGAAVLVDQMTCEQARVLLTAGLPPLDEAVAAGLLAVTGRWPLLLRLVNRILADYSDVSGDVSAQAAVLVEQLREAGPQVVDGFLGDAGRGLDINRPEQRARAVRATIGASTGLLTSDDADRFAELGVFVEDEVIPFALVARLWRVTAGVDELRAARVCKRLAHFALITIAEGASGGIMMHDVIRDFVRAELGKERLAELNGSLIEAVAAVLPALGTSDSAGR